MRSGNITQVLLKMPGNCLLEMNSLIGKENLGKYLSLEYKPGLKRNAEKLIFVRKFYW